MENCVYKEEYVPPILEVYEFAVEHGFAASVVRDDILIGDVSDNNENVKEGKSYGAFNDSLWY